MKRLKIFSIILLVVSAGAFVAFQGYTRMIQDKTPPVITCDSPELTVSVGAEEQDLLNGVTAKDNRSGDVSDTLVVESISEFVERFPELSLFYRLFSPLDSEMICIFPYFCPCEEIRKENKGNFYAKVCKRRCQWQVLCI